MRWRHVLRGLDHFLAAMGDAANGGRSWAADRVTALLEILADAPVDPTTRAVARHRLAVLFSPMRGPTHAANDD